MIRDLNIRAVVTRILTLEDRAFTVEDGQFGGFTVSLMPPTRFPTQDGSPRDGDPHVLHWQAGLLGPVVVPQAGWRVGLERPVGRSYENLTYELLSDPSEVRLGPSTDAVQAPVMTVPVLYPYSGVLKEQDGTEVGAIGVALWSDREDHADTGTYERFSGEAPVEFAPELSNNRWIDLGGQRYRITSSIVDLEGPRVKFEARRANA